MYVFEPQQTMLELLCANAALNDLDQIRPWNLAVEALPGMLRVPPTDHEGSANFGSIATSRGMGPGEVVRAVTLDEHLAEEAWTPRRLRLLKIDVEGMELEVLQGARELIERFQPMIYVENDRKQNSPALIEWLFGANYSVYWHLMPYFTDDNFYGCERDPFLEATGKRLLSAYIVCVPKHGVIEGAEVSRVYLLMDW